MTEYVIVHDGSGQTLEANGASALNGDYVQADDAIIDFSGAGQFPPAARYVAEFTLASAPGANAALSLQLRELDVVGANDTPQPSANYDDPDATAMVPNAAGTHTIQFHGPLALKAQAWLKPQGFNLPAAWKLYVYYDTEQAV